MIRQTILERTHAYVCMYIVHLHTYRSECCIASIASIAEKNQSRVFSKSNIVLFPAQLFTWLLIKKKLKNLKNRWKEWKFAKTTRKNQFHTFDYFDFYTEFWFIKINKLNVKLCTVKMKMSQKPQFYFNWKYDSKKKNGLLSPILLT